MNLQAKRGNVPHDARSSDLERFRLLHTWSEVKARDKMKALIEKEQFNALYCKLGHDRPVAPFSMTIKLTTTREEDEVRLSCCPCLRCRVRRLWFAVRRATVRLMALFRRRRDE